MNTGQIIKSKQTERFTVIPNAILEDNRLSLREIGLLCYILRLPADWGLNKTRLHVKLKEGRDAVAVAFKTLENCGYIVKNEVRENGKFAGFNYIVYDKPQILNGEQEQPFTENPVTVPETEKPFTEKPETVKPETDNPALLKTDFNKKEDIKDLSTKNGTGTGKNLFGDPELAKPDKPRKGKTAQGTGPPAPLPEIVLPWETETFKTAWKNWKDYKAGEHKFQYKTLLSQQAALLDLNGKAEGIEEKAIKIINHTMGNGWKGFVVPKNNDNGNNGYQTTDRNENGFTSGQSSIAARITANNAKYGD